MTASGSGFSSSACSGLPIRHVEESDDDACPDCLPRSRCLACEDDERFHIDRDTRCEEQAI